MAKYVPYAKLSKRKRKEADRQKRAGWDINPVTRRPKMSKAYDRKKAPRPGDPDAGFYFSTERRIFYMLFVKSCFPPDESVHHYVILITD